MSLTLESVVQAVEMLEKQGRSTEVFFRNDDVDVVEDNLIELLDVFGGAGVPLSLAIIPARLTDDAIRSIGDYLDRFPYLFEPHQHGFQHVNHELTGRKCEFGPSRTYAQQRADITAGHRLLKQAFGPHLAPIFTPPWNRCTRETFAVLDEIDFRILSRDRSEAPIRGYRLRETSVTLDIFSWKHGPRLRPADAIARDLCDQLRSGDPVGIMLHHKVMNREAFQLIRQILGILRFPQVGLRTIATLRQWQLKLNTSAKPDSAVERIQQ